VFHISAPIRLGFDADKVHVSPNRWLSAFYQRTKEAAVDHSIRGRGTRVYLGPLRKDFRKQWPRRLSFRAGEPLLDPA
jgi:hypothetical protein